MRFARSAAFLLALTEASCGPSREQSLPAAGVRAAERGLEILTWACDDASGALQTALLPYLDAPTPLPPSIVERWRLNGLRVFAVPADELERVRDQLPLLGVTQRQWLGESPAWITGVGGPVNTHPAFLRFDGVESTLEPGRMAISVRCWLSPTHAGEPALRLEICPNHTPAAPKRSFSTKLQASPIDTRLAASMLVSEGIAIVIVSAAPEAVWGLLASESEADAETGADSHAGVEFLGPPTAAIPTLGEAMLSTWPPPGQRRPKAVIAFIPKVPKDAEFFSAR